MSETGKIIEAEKGKDLSPRNIHIRLRVVEYVMLVSLGLNLALWYFAGNINAKTVDKIAGSREAQIQR